MASAIKSILFVVHAQRVPAPENTEFAQANRLPSPGSIPPFESCRRRSASATVSGAPLYAPSRITVRRTVDGSDKRGAGEFGPRMSVFFAGLLLGFSAAYFAQTPLTLGRVTLLAWSGVVILLRQLIRPTS
jgi:hypothetical protein